MDVSSETLNFFYEGTEGIILFYYLRSFDGIDTFVRTFVRSKVFLYRHMSRIYSVCMDTYLRSYLRTYYVCYGIIFFGPRGRYGHPGCNNVPI